MELCYGSGHRGHPSKKKKKMMMMMRMMRMNASPEQVVKGGNGRRKMNVERSCFDWQSQQMKCCC
jgi:hypothetical protein